MSVPPPGPPDERTDPPQPALPGKQERRDRPRRAGARGRRTPKPPAPPPAIPERGADPEQLIVGRVAAAHGTQGEFRMAILTNHPEHLATLRTIYLGLGDDREPQQVRRIQLRGGEAVVKVAALTTPADVAARRGQLVWIDRADVPPLPEGEFYHYQLLGLEVVDLDGQSLGRLARIIETGANDVYVVVGPNGETLLPAIESVVREVDPAGGRMVVQVPEYY